MVVLVFIPKGYALRLFVSKQFQVLFHWVINPSFQRSLTVLVHYRSVRVFSLGAWSPQILTEFFLHGTQVSRTSSWISDTRLSLSLVTDSKVFSYPQRMDIQDPTTPCKQGLGFSAFAHRYSRNLFDFSSSGY